MNRLMLRPALLLSLLLGQAVQAAPVADRLERPASLSTLASHDPLTAIQTVGDHQVMVGDSGHILLRAADGGVTQAQVPVDLLLTALCFVDARNGWAVGHDGVILHSSDAGQTWQKQLDGNAINQLLKTWADAEVSRLQQATAAQPNNKDLAAALDNALFALDDVKAGSATGPARPLLDLWFRDAQQGWAVGAYGMILNTTDGGQHWAYLPGLDNPDRLHLNSVLGLADGTLLVAGEGGRIYRSPDNGQTWQAALVTGPASLYKLLALNNGHLLALGFGGALFSSQDKGLSWQALATPVKAGLYGGSQLADGSVLLAGQGGVILYSADGEHFHAWRSTTKAAWLGVEAVSATQLALVGTAGLATQSLAELKEHLQ